MAAGRRAAAMAASTAAALLLLLLAGGAYADCYTYCFNDCMGRLNQRDYCNYACDSRCNPDADATLHQRPALADVGPEAMTDHRRPLGKKQDAAVWPAALLPNHPFHETHGGAVEPEGEPDPEHVVPPAPEDAAVWPAALPNHPFHETHGGAVEPEPEHAVLPALPPSSPDRVIVGAREMQAA